MSVVLVGVFSPPVRLKVKATKAEGGLIVDPRERHLLRHKCYFHRQDRSFGTKSRFRLNSGLNSLKERARRTCRANQEEVALGEAGLNRRDVEWLKQLGLEQLADPGDLVTRQSGI